MVIADGAGVRQARESLVGSGRRFARRLRSSLTVLAGSLVIALPIGVVTVARDATAAAAAVSAPTCGAHQLSAIGDWGGATQFQLGGVSLSSWSDQYCVLRGYVSVHISAWGKPLAVKEVHDLHLASPRTIKSPPTVLFPPGQTFYAGFNLQWQNWCGSEHGPFSVDLTLPNHQRLPVVDRTDLSTLRTPPSCLERSKPSELLVQPIVVNATSSSSLAGVVNAPTVKIGTFSGVLPEWISVSGDANNVVTSLNWVAWNPQMAVALGAWEYNDCTPDCAGGTSTPYPTLISLSDPIHGSFTEITEQQSGPHGRSYSFVLPNRFLNAGTTPMQSGTGRTTTTSTSPQLPSNPSATTTLVPNVVAVAHRSPNVDFAFKVIQAAGLDPKELRTTLARAAGTALQWCPKLLPRERPSQWEVTCC